MTRPFFTRERISDFEIYDRNCSLSLKEAGARAKEGYSIDFQVELRLHVSCAKPILAIISRYL